MKDDLFPCAVVIRHVNKPSCVFVLGTCVFIYIKYLSNKWSLYITQYELILTINRTVNSYPNPNAYPNPEPYHNTNPNRDLNFGGHLETWSWIPFSYYRSKPASCFSVFLHFVMDSSDEEVEFDIVSKDYDVRPYIFQLLVHDREEKTSLFRPMIQPTKDTHRIGDVDW